MSDNPILRPVENAKGWTRDNLDVFWTGIEPASSSFHEMLYILMVRITDHLRPIEIGVTNRNRTGTNAFTGRDAAVTS